MRKLARGMQSTECRVQSTRRARVGTRLQDAVRHLAAVACTAEIIMESGIFSKQNTIVYMLIYGVKDSNPRRYAIYDVDNVAEARQRLEAKHPEYIFLGEEIMLGKEDAKTLSRAFNKAMDVYPSILLKYPFPPVTP